MKMMAMTTRIIEQKAGAYYNHYDKWGTASILVTIYCGILLHDTYAVLIIYSLEINECYFI